MGEVDIQQILSTGQKSKEKRIEIVDLQRNLIILSTSNEDKKQGVGRDNKVKEYQI
jgi:hypothetical protein